MSARGLFSEIYRASERAILLTSLGNKWLSAKWRFRHLYRAQWATRYLSTADAAHRAQFTDLIREQFPDCGSLCEVGCGSGVNLFNFRKHGLAAFYFGFDINPSGIRTARRHAKSIGAANMKFDRANILDPICSTHDVIVTDAVLMFIGQRNIRHVLANLWRSTTKGLILHEFNGPDALEGGRYIHDFESLLKAIDHEAIVEIVKSTKTDSAQWSQYGSFVCARKVTSTN